MTQKTVIITQQFCPNKELWYWAMCDGSQGDRWKLNFAPPLVSPILVQCWMAPTLLIYLHAITRILIVFGSWSDAVNSSTHKKIIVSILSAWKLVSVDTTFVLTFFNYQISNPVRFDFSDLLRFVSFVEFQNDTLHSNKNNNWLLNLCSSSNVVSD